jgi:peroxiredoxin
LILSAAAFAAAPAPAAPRPGSPAPDFTLTDAAGKSHTLSAYKGKWVVLEWVNYDCPFVRKHYGSGNMQKLQKASRGKGAVWLSINSSAPGKQGHFEGEALAARMAKEKAAMDAYLLDADGKAGRLYKAKTTPHMFVINPEGVVTYAGAIDDKPSTDMDDIAGAFNYVQAALDAGLAGKPVETASTAPYGCGVKYGDK